MLSICYLLRWLRHGITTSHKYTDSGIGKENAQRLNFSCLTEAVMPEVKVEA